MHSGYQRDVYEYILGKTGTWSWGSLGHFCALELNGITAGYVNKDRKKHIRDMEITANTD